MNPGIDGWNTDFEALSRQYWNAWSEMARQAGSGRDAGVPGWKDAVELWAPWARMAVRRPTMP